MSYTSYHLVVYTYIGLRFFVQCHINLYGLFNAKTTLVEEQ